MKSEKYSKESIEQFRLMMESKNPCPEHNLNCLLQEIRNNEQAQKIKKQNPSDKK